MNSSWRTYLQTQRRDRSTDKSIRLIHSSNAKFFDAERHPKRDSRSCLAAFAAVLFLMAGQGYAADVITNPVINPPRIQLNPPYVRSVTPSFGSGGTLTITGDNVDLADKVTVGGSSVGFSRNPDGSLTAYAESYNLKDVGTVPVVAWLNGQTRGTSAYYSLQVAGMQISGPFPYDPTSSSQPVNADYSILNTIPNLKFPVAKPVLHVPVEFDASVWALGTGNLPPGSVLAGNQAKFNLNVEMCDITKGPPANGTNGCTDWNNNAGQWVDPLGGDGYAVGGESPDFTVTLNPNETADLAVDVSSLFDQQNLVRTIRLDLRVILQNTAGFCGEACWNYFKTSNSFIVAITPAALLQLNVIPYTILYAPPGNQSTATLGTTSTFTSQFSLGNSQQTSNQTSDTQTQKTDVQAGVKLDLASAVTLGLSSDSSNTWDQTTSTTVTTQVNSGTGGQASNTFQNSWTIGPNNSLLPGNGQTCATATNCSTTKTDPNWYMEQPFWEDTFFLQVHPQFGTYVLSNGQDQTVWYAAAPELVAFTVSQLYDCATGNHFLGKDWCQAQAGGYSQLLDPQGNEIGYKGNQQPLTLSQSDAANLLKLDPFYVGGQNPWLPASRALPVPNGQGIPYGGQIGQQDPIKYQNNFNNTNVTNWSSGSQNTLDTSISASYGTDQSTGASIGVASPAVGGESVNVTIGNGVKSSQTTDTRLTYTDSTANSQQLATQASVTLDDFDNQHNCAKCHDPLPNEPTANVFIDRQFGSYMFQDPGAPPQQIAYLTVPESSVVHLQSLLAQVQSTSQFPDVAVQAASNVAIGVLAQTGLMAGYPDGNFHPGDALTAGQLATVVARALNLSATSAATALTPAVPEDSLAAATRGGLIVTEPGAAVGVNDVISRQSMAFTLARAFKLASAAPAILADGGQIGSWATSSVASVIAAGYMRLTANGTFEPTAPVTRADAAVALSAALTDHILAAAKPDIASGAARVMTLVSGNDQTGVSGSAVSNPVVVEVTDGNGKPLADFPVVFTAVNGGGKISASQVNTDSTGRASADWTLGAAGENMLTASSSVFGGRELTFVAQAESR